MESKEKRKPLKVKEVESRINELLAADTSDAVLLDALLSLSKERHFGEFTWLWGSVLYKRNRAYFRTFIHERFSTWKTSGFTGWAMVEWKGEVGKHLHGWLEMADEVDDISMFQRLFGWKIQKEWRGKKRTIVCCQELTRRLQSAKNDADRVVVLAKFDFWFFLDEKTACLLYEHCPKQAPSFILKRIGFYGEKRALWSRLHTLIEQAGDEKFLFALYRKTVPLKQWLSELNEYCGSIGEASELNNTLEARHPEGYYTEIGEGLLLVLEKRGRDVFPYVFNHLKHALRGFWKNNPAKLLKLAEERGWEDLWSAIVRICLMPKDYNREIKKILETGSLAKDEQVRRLLLLTGISREWNWGGFGIARLNFLDDETALLFYEKYPELLRGPFRVHLQSGWRRNYIKLTARILQNDDEELIDFFASRLVTRINAYGQEESIRQADLYADYYSEIKKKDEAFFAYRAANVLNLIPAYTIYAYRDLIRKNRLARLFFERSTKSMLGYPNSLADLVEAPEIHVQALAYKALGSNDERARKTANAHLDILIGTLLRPLHRKTRILAFKALVNAARVDQNSACRVLRKAREALDLPDIRYPKEQLVRLIGQVLYFWPELCEPSERTVVYTRPLSH